MIASFYFLVLFLALSFTFPAAYFWRLEDPKHSQPPRNFEPRLSDEVDTWADTLLSTSKPRQRKDFGPYEINVHMPQMHGYEWHSKGVIGHPPENWPLSYR